MIVVLNGNVMEENDDFEISESEGHLEIKFFFGIAAGDRVQVFTPDYRFGTQARGHVPKKDAVSQMGQSIGARGKMPDNVISGRPPRLTVLHKG